ncbi:MAG: hypothetical protein IJ666_00615 [Ruminococcus sp.]|nr:hypothetical protein [Ruminococcus sp.]
MKKLISLLAVSVIIASCFAGCGDTGTSETELSSSSSSQTDEETAEEETTEEETTEEVTEEETTAEVTEEELSDEEEEIPEIETVPMPEYNPDDAAEDDFVGNWECTKMLSAGQFGHIIEGDLYGIPLNVVAQIIINDDNTGVLSSGLEGSEDAATKFTWEFADKRLNLTIDDEDEEIENMFLYMQDGDLIMSSDADEELVYFQKVDQLTYFTEEDLYKAMGIDPADIVADVEGEDTEDTEDTVESEEPETAAEE